MRKRDLNWGIGAALLGTAFIAAAVFTENPLESLIWGLGGGALAPGLIMIVRYFYWSAQKNESRFQELQEKRDIEMRDELNEKLRDKSGRIAYLAGLLILCLFELAFTLLGKMGLVPGYKIFISCLFGLLVLQILIGMAAFHLLRKKY